MLSVISLYFIAFLFGLLLGNFTTTAFYRLPRNITILGFDTHNTQPPCCSICMHPLKFYEYLPLFSWCSTFWKCNYCGKPVDLAYFCLEISNGMVALLLYSILGFSEKYMLLSVFSAITILQIAMYYRFQKIWIFTVYIQIITGIIFRTLSEGMISPWIISLSASILIFVGLRGKNSALPVLAIGGWGNIPILLIYILIRLIPLTKTYYIEILYLYGAILALHTSLVFQ